MNTTKPSHRKSARAAAAPLLSKCLSDWRAPTVALVLFLLSASAVSAGIAVDGTSSATGSATTLTWPHTVGIGGDRLLIVGVSIRNAGNTVQEITYGGAQLSFVGARNNHDDAVRAEIWSLASPPTGTANIAVTLSGGAKMVGGALSFFGVNPAAPLGTYASAFSTDSGTLDPSVTLSSAAGEVVVDVLALQGSAGSMTPLAGQTQHWNLFYGPGGGDAAGAASTAPGAASVTASWSKASNAKWATVAVPLRPAPTVSTTLYLKGDGVPLASLSVATPAAGVLPNYTPGRHGFPGLYLYATGNGWSETDPEKHEQWVATSDGPDLDGPVNLTFWSAMKSFKTGKRGVAEAYLLDCDSLGADCSLIAQGARDIFDWSGGWGSWNEYSIDFGNVTYAFAAGRSLSVKLVAGNDADDDMVFAYDTATYPSRLTDGAASDIVIDCDFSDWFDAEGTEFDVIDQGGPDDWDNPIRLDLTRFAVSSNTVDSFHVLMGFDDVPPQNATAATLIDTDVDGMVDAALVATLDGSTAAVERYSCDDTLTDGCGGAVLEQSYPQSYFCLGSGAGPWNNDSFLEATLPFNDLGVRGDDIVLTALVSYAAASLLTAPKDAIFGTSGQDYDERILVNPKSGKTTPVGLAGPNVLVRRATDPSAVRTASIHATVTQAPYDDTPGSLSDGENYFYVIEREGGIPLKLSLNANVPADAPRVGFDDGDPLSAPVDAFQSTVSLDVSSIPTDGTSTATVTVVPRESDGTSIGTGCEVSLDPAAVLPGTMAGPGKDNLDGSFTFRITSTGTGTGNVVVTVEGIVLDTQPAITFTAF